MIRKVGYSKIAFLISSFAFYFFLIACTTTEEPKNISPSKQAPESTNYESNQSIQKDILIENVPSNGVKIGNQIWHSKNLDISEFRNGDSIPQAKTDIEWESAEKNKQAAWCYYNFNPMNGDKYGKLYNWYAINDTRGLAPEGWHIPSASEWEELIIELGGADKAGKKIMSPQDSVGISNVTNLSGFSAHPGGYRGLFLGFQDIDRRACWWSSSLRDDSPIHYSLDFKLGYLKRSESINKEDGRSIRCLMN
jgi:uncharacterized protein (TIGR02145 family)